jgi:hypothetical protein
MIVGETELRALIAAQAALIAALTLRVEDLETTLAEGGDIELRIAALENA